MDLSKLQGQLATLMAALPEIQEQVRARAVEEAVEGGAMVRVVPEWFPMPVRARKGEPGNVDPWFSYNQWEWQAEMDAGFDGWMVVDEGSARNKRKIHFESARQWFARKLEAQRVLRERRGA